MARRVFIPNPSFADDYLRSDASLPMLQDLADEAAAVARTLAPVREGDYRDSIEGLSGFNDDGIASGRLVATDWKAHWIEAGTGQPGPTPPYRVLGRAVEAIAGRVGA